MSDEKNISNDNNLISKEIDKDDDINDNINIKDDKDNTSKEIDKEIDKDNDKNKDIYDTHLFKPDDEVWEKSLKTVDNLKEILHELLRESIYQAYSSKESKDKTDSEMTILINEYYKNNLNEMWHVYGEKRDQKTIDDIDLILSIGFIKGLTCLMSWLAGVGTIIINTFDIDMINRSTNLNFIPFMMYVDATIRMHIYTMIVKEIEDYVTRGCSDECNNDKNVCGYDGNDIIDEYGKYKPFIRIITNSTEK
jgi:hypothetical protein